MLMIKYNCHTPIKNKHLMISDEVDEISPLRSKEFDEINKKLETAHAKNPTPTKNTTPVRRLQQRRILAQKNGLLAKKESASKRLKMTMETTLLSEMQKEIINHAKNGMSLFFTGAAGTGKSHLLKELIKILPPETTAVTASTGCAAAPLHGQTLHAFAGFGIGKTTAEAIKERIE
jgi:DNA replication protein DnaC